MSSRTDEIINNLQAKAFCISYCPKCGRKYDYCKDGFYETEYVEGSGRIPDKYFKCPNDGVVMPEIIETKKDKPQTDGLIYNVNGDAELL